MGAIDGMLRLLDDRSDPEREAGLRTFEQIFALILGVEYWLRAVPKWGQLAPTYLAQIGIASVLCLAALLPRWKRLAFAGLALNHGFLVWQEFPAAGNHAYLETLLCGLASLLDPRKPAEKTLYLRSVRWIIVLIFFWSGIQKMIHGYWFQGQFLAFSLTSASFEPILSPFLSSAELARLKTFAGRVGDGPYLVESWPFLAVSNATWLVEILIAPFLVLHATRIAATLCGIALIAAIETGAREIFFGLVFSNGVLLFLPAWVHRRAVLPLVLLLAGMSLSRLGVLPEVIFY